MSKETFIIEKTTPDDVIFFLHPVSNPSLNKLIHLTSRSPKLALPKDWAIGVFFDDGAYSLYKAGAFTFDDNEALAQAGMDAGVYFNESLDFVPAQTGKDHDVLDILKKGVRSEIVRAIDNFGKDFIISVAGVNADSLTTGVLRTLEELLGVQLIVNND